jgi:hypothetical protein
MTALLSGVKPQPFSAVRDDVPPALEAAILAAIVREPAERLPSVAGLAALLASAQRDVESTSQLTAVEPSPAVAQRQFARVPYAAPARLVRSQGHVDGRTEDISEGGVLVLADAAVEQGERMQLRIPLPSAGRVATIDVVARWCKGLRGRYAIGLGFESSRQDLLADIRRYALHMTSDRAGVHPDARWLGSSAK